MVPVMDNIGPMASTVTDVALLLDVIAGYDDGRDHRQRADLVVPKYSQMVCEDHRLHRLNNSINNSMIKSIVM